MLAFRSDLARAIRAYFHQEGVLEVVTPVLRDSGSSEAHLQNLMTNTSPPLYLQTSPEYAMKCLLGAHGASIYQICPAFRGGETGSRHSVEFQMLEWYRLGYTLTELMDDLVSLIEFIVEELNPPGLEFNTIDGVSYHRLFEDRFGLNPHQADLETLKSLAKDLDHLGEDAGLSDVLDALFSTHIEPGLEKPTIVYEYPACQAALAELNSTLEGDTVADRFELYIGGIELANAYQELDDVAELKKRFAENNRLRRELAKPEVPDDAALIAATGQIGQYAGIALGIDRLAMVLWGADTLNEARP